MSDNRSLDGDYWGPIGRRNLQMGGAVFPTGGRQVDQEGNRIAGGDRVVNVPGQVGRGIGHAEEQPAPTAAKAALGF